LWSSRSCITLAGIIVGPVKQCISRSVYNGIMANRVKLVSLGAYLLRQLPIWTLLGVLLFALRNWTGASWSLAATALTIWIVKDFVIFIWLPRPDAQPRRTGAQELIGGEGVVRSPLEPFGFILTRGELWRAEAVSSENPIPVGTLVQIREARGLTLRVKPTRSRFRKEK